MKYQYILVNMVAKHLVYQLVHFTVEAHVILMQVQYEHCRGELSVGQHFLIRKTTSQLVFGDIKIYLSVLVTNNLSRTITL